MTQTAKNRCLIIGLALFLCLGGCLDLKQKTPAFYYYTLEYTAPHIQGTKTLKSDLYVDRFIADPPYDTERMIYSRNKFEREAYLYHRWERRPGEMVSSLLARDLRESRTFHRVYREYLPPTDAYRLKGVVEDFLERDFSGHREAFLRMRIILSKPDKSTGNERILSEKTYLARKSLKSESPEGLAWAMSQALKEVSASLIKDISHILEKQASTLKE